MATPVDRISEILAGMHLVMLAYYSYQFWISTFRVYARPQLQNKYNLRQKMTKAFSTNELKALAFDLDIDYQQLPIEDKLTFIMELIVYCERRNMTNEFLDSLNAARPHINWHKLS